MPARCDEVADALPSILDGRLGADRSVVDHVEHCLRCQAELARYRRLLRVLHQLNAEDVELPNGALAEVLESVGRAATRRAIRSALTGRRIAYSAGLVGAIVATSGVVLATRSRGSQSTKRAESS